MYLPYANLVHFTTEPSIGSMSEARLTLQVLGWVGEAQDIIDENYLFTVTYLYNPFGLAVDASIWVQKKVGGDYLTLGRFSPSGATLSSIIEAPVCDPICTPSDIVSEPLHYYVEEYYEEEYYV